MTGVTGCGAAEGEQTKQSNKAVKQSSQTKQSNKAVKQSSQTKQSNKAGQAGNVIFVSIMLRWVCTGRHGSYRASSCNENQSSARRR
jgi:hypothetical protein